MQPAITYEQHYFLRVLVAQPEYIDFLLSIDHNQIPVMHNLKMAMAKLKEEENGRVVGSVNVTVQPSDKLIDPPKAVVYEDHVTSLNSETWGQVAPVKEKKKKAEKKPGEPKHATSGYQFYGKWRRQDLKSQGLNGEYWKTTSQVAAEWNAMDKEARKPFMDMGATDKIRYAEQQQAYLAKMAAGPS